MKKGKVKSFNTKKGFGGIQYDQDKEIYVHHTALQGSQIKSLAEGQEVIFEIKQGRKGPEADKVRLSSNQLKLFHGNKKIEEVKGKPRFLEARAPYNFVPLNEQVVPSDTKVDKIDHSKYQDGKYTGFIILNITTETPLYIRDTLNESEIEEEEKFKKKYQKDHPKCKYINSDFFSPAGTIRIPGSSLRGMIRNMVEIVSYSNLKFFEEHRKYHFRSFADRFENIKNEYWERMGRDLKGNKLKKLKAGYLVKRGINLKIIPAKKINERQYFRVDEDSVLEAEIINTPMSVKDENGGYIKNDDYEIDYKQVWFTLNEKKEKVDKIAKAEEELENSNEGGLVLSGWMPGSEKKPRGKTQHWVIGPPDENEAELEIPEGVIDDYKDDFLRHEQANLLRNFKKKPYEKVPCFYVLESNAGNTDKKEISRVKSFGHTALFRLSYDHKIGDLIPKAMKDFSGNDITEAIFGNEKSFAGRVFFEDAFLDEGQRDICSNETAIKILSKPKPTTFQHYLRQEAEKQLRTYNDGNAQLAGYKLYWHRSGESEVWKKKNIPLDKVGKTETQYTKIKAVNKKKTFTGKIRFANLSEIELGALLFVLDLPKGHCHKIGMGKPLGLGSISIIPELHLSERKERYKNLFLEWGEPIKQSSADKIKHSKHRFAAYILSHIEGPDIIGDSVESLWKSERMKELKAMLDFENKPDDSKTRYMEIERKTDKDKKKKNEFIFRNILPKPTEVKKL